MPDTAYLTRGRGVARRALDALELARGTLESMHALRIRMDRDLRQLLAADADGEGWKRTPDR